MLRRLAPLRRLPALALSMVGLLAGCEDGPTGPSSAIEAVLIQPSSPEVIVGESVSLRAEAVGPDGRPVGNDRDVAWAIEDTSRATVSGLGRLTGRTAGTTRVRATIEGVTGSAPVRVLEVPAASVTVEPAEPELLTGDTLRLMARVRDKNGDLLEAGSVLWRSSNPEIATVGDGGLVAAHGRGQARITAEVGGVEGEALVTVRTADVAEIVVRPARDSLEVGEVRRFTAERFDAGGHRITVGDVLWSSSSPSVVTVDRRGRATAEGAGGATIAARSGGARDTAEVVVTGGGGGGGVDGGDGPGELAITGISPDVLEPGDLAVLFGRGFSADPARNTVTVAGVKTSVQQAASGELQVRLPEEGFTCRPTGEVEIRVTVDRGDTTPSTTRPHTLRTAASVELTAGEVVRLTTGNPLRDCVELEEASGEYVVNYYHASRTTPGKAAFRIHGETPSGGESTPAFHRRSVAVRTTTPEEQETSRLHHRVLTANRRLAERYASQLRIRGARYGQDLQSAPAPSVGDTVTLHVPDLDDLCSGDAVPGRVVYSGDPAVVLEDVNNNSAGSLDSRYEAMGREFDESMFPVITQYFGDPLAYDEQLDDNGRIFMLFSDLVTEKSEGLLLGFVTSADFRQASTSCPSGDQAEVFYARTPTRPQEPNESAEEWHRKIRSTVIHEVKHLTANAERFARSAGTFEDSWLEEGTAVIAEELWARAVFGYDRGQNTGYDESVGCELDGGVGCEDVPRVMFAPFARLYTYLQSPENRTPFAGLAGNPDSSFYGSAWSLLRWAADRFAVSESSFFRDLIQTDRHGIHNLETVTGRTYEEMLSNFAMSLVADDHPELTSVPVSLRHPSWDHRDIFEGLNDWNGSFFPKPFPIAFHERSFGVFDVEVGGLQAGSSTYLRISGSGAESQILQIKGFGGGAPPSTVGVTILRIR